jgi:hypothetical protein
LDDWLGGKVTGALKMEWFWRFFGLLPCSVEKGR